MSAPTDFEQLPVVDVSSLRSGDPADRQRVADALGRAARDVGFLYVEGTGIAPDLFADLLAATRRFFALPVEEKMRVYIGNSHNHRGYVPEGEEVFSAGTRDLKEASTSPKTSRLTIPTSLPATRCSDPTSGPSCPDSPSR